jgi:uncharacterized membrane protein YoaK (UPF0700 family)
MKLALPLLLSVLGGYVDTASFLALQGLFTSHVTGNFVTLGAALVLGRSGILNKLIALPVFCLVVGLVRLLGHAMSAHVRTAGSLTQFRVLLGLQVLLLAAGGGLAIRLGPFPDGDAAPALLTGMTLVCAMAIQNAVQRAYLPARAPTTIMTGTTTQVMIDFVDLLLGRRDPVAGTGRLARMSLAIAAFGFGCGTAALLFSLVGMGCFLLPPVLASIALGLKSDIVTPS